MMVVASTPRLLDLDEWVTVDEAAKFKGSTYDAVRMWLRIYPGQALVCRVGRTLLIRKADLVKYTPRQKVN